MENSKSLRLFSKETLDSAVMSEIYGGDAPSEEGNDNCGDKCIVIENPLCGLANIFTKCNKDES